MNKIYSKIFTGFLLVILDVSIGNFDILPDIIGYLLVLLGLSALYSKIGHRSFSIARIFVVFMSIFSFYEIVINLRLIENTNVLSYIILTVGSFTDLMLIVFIYQGMTHHMSTLEESNLSKKFSSENKRFIIIQGVSVIAMSFSLNMTKESGGYFLIIIFAISFIMHIRFLMNLSYIKKYFEKSLADDCS